MDKLELLKPFIAKGTSARFIMAIMFSLTYCAIMVACTVALLKKIVTVETYVALLGAFALIVREIADDYFNKEKKDTIENGGVK